MSQTSRVILGANGVQYGQASDADDSRAEAEI